MVKRYHASFPSLSYGFDSRYPLQSSGPSLPRPAYLSISPQRVRKRGVSPPRDHPFGANKTSILGSIPDFTQIARVCSVMGTQSRKPGPAGLTDKRSALFDLWRNGGRIPVQPQPASRPAPDRPSSPAPHDPADEVRDLIRKFANPKADRIVLF